MSVSDITYNEEQAPKNTRWVKGVVFGCLSTINGLFFMNLTLSGKPIAGLSNLSENS
jgi:hypothetical protein